MVDDLRLRMLDDLLAAERNFRDLAERKVRALTGVLTELAYRLAGEKLEQMRQLDPSAPSSWKPEEWRSFFLSISLTPQGEGWGKANGSGQAAEIAALQAKIATLERELARVRERGYEVPPVERVAQVNPLLVSAGEGRLAGFTLPKIPKAWEHRWQVRAEMSKADAELHLKRRGMVLKCLAEGLSVQVEIGRYVGDATGAQYRSGAIRRVFEALEESGLIVRQTLTLQVTGNLPTRLAVARLSEEGKQFCRALGWPVVESDWERLIRLHEGEKQEGHTLAVLLFASAARLRGWTVEVLPEVHGNARPDMVITKGEQRLYVEVETGTRLHDGNAKWRMNAELNGGRVALVARNVEERGVLVADCRHAAEHGHATDVETLIAGRLVEVGEGDPLWAEEW
ncbi:MAG: hypothetical protein ACPLUL_13545 [Thermanaerothrix sp.]|uniref:hypothetical protein n=1 Tax=Thermanaerothrix sp. TaxID=2972675 RepID=UPI003C7D964A